ncbi:PHEROMONE-REGULATED MEMBRANE PROTEIN 10 [Ceraceosorus bombacis]|uniref:PHEROMONE-REGULATED MEMBRANE PROTEIN 10 n=1 Tax=Ceraceosorus bombacis TaxID=401625 RepID=A0A0P1BG36_9BASI|nr:PHEROMONE-REGULATED MEMBRANE PROTEIN 10 [Ceraceosorus bombacis]
MSGASTPGVEWASGTSDTGSYDPAADSDLDHIDVIPGETDGMPSRPRRRKTQQQKREDEQEEQPKGWARLRAILRKPAEDEEGDEKGLPTTTADVGNDEASGPTNRKSVPVTTSTGTHSGPRHRPTRFEREAARLVKAHRLMTGQSVESDGMPGGAAAAGLGRMPTMSRKHLDSEASTPDALDTAANLDARPVAAGGVLGNLLRLYEQQQREAARKQKELAESRATSPLSTPPVSGVRGGAGAPANLSDLVAAELARETAATASSIGPVPADARSKARRRSYWSAENTGGANSPGPAALAGAFVAEGTAKIAGATKKVAQVAARESGIDDAVDDRPKAARSNAGTIGGLVAVTGNLIGAVSPWHAQLGPNPKRPGYTLDRYLLPEMNEKTLRKTAEIVADAAPRPRRSAPGTPHLPGIGTSVSSSPHPNDSSETAAASPQDGAASPHKTASRPASVLLGPARRNTDATVGGNAHRKGSSLSQFSSHLYGKHGWRSNVNTPDHGWRSNVNTPDVYTADSGGDYFGRADPEMDDKLQKLEWQRKLKKRAKDKRKKEEIFITMHVAAILQRQEFLLKLARALMMFGAPTHRIETQIQQTARVLEINARCIYLPNLMLLAFGDDATHTSETKFIKQAGGLDLTKLTDMHSIYWNVIHDKIGVEEASSQLDELMRRKPVIGMWPMVFIGGFCSSFICVGSMGFNGSFIDALVAFPLGMFLVYCQSVITTELFSNVFEIVFAAINSFVASALASTQYFCYAAVVSGSIVLILPGFIVLSGSLELQSKNLIAGSVRLVYAIIYSLFLGFGISIGSSFWLLFSGSGDSTIQYLNCTDPAVHPPNVWWRETVPLAWGFLTVPGYATALSMRNQVKVNRKEFPVMVLIACAGWAVNHFSSTAGALTGRQDITSALGSLCVGVLANIYGRIFDGRAFVVSVPGILYQLPSGLSNGGLLNFARSGTGSSATSNFNSGFDVAQSLVEVAIGLTVGLFAATMLAYVFGGRKIRGGGLFSF